MPARTPVPSILAYRHLTSLLGWDGSTRFARRAGSGIELLRDRAQTGLAASLPTGATDDLPSLPGRWGRNTGLRVILRTPEPGVLVEVSVEADREAQMASTLSRFSR